MHLLPICGHIDCVEPLFTSPDSNNVPFPLWFSHPLDVLNSSMLSFFADSKAFSLIISSPIGTFCCLKTLKKVTIPKTSPATFIEKGENVC